ncbi:hypothetical protein [Exiguobacterium sp. R-17]|uniref:hypothetical protein n=1 Tax=Exiguobacterium sp. R-17 TaxID=3404054 RepID=UPI003CEFA921
MQSRVLLILFALLIFHVAWPLPWYALAVLGGVIGIIKGYTADEGIVNIFNLKKVSYSLQDRQTRQEAVLALMCSLLTVDFPYWFAGATTGITWRDVGYVSFEVVSTLLFAYVLFRFLCLDLFRPFLESERREQRNG